MNKTLAFSLLATTLAVGVAVATFWPEDAAARAGNSSSVGSRGSRSFSTPRQATPAPTGSGQMRQSTPAATPGAAATAPRTTAPGAATAAPHTAAPVPAPAMPASSGLSSGLLGGLGGLALGGLLGATLFGGSGSGAAAGSAAAGSAGATGGVAGSGIGLLEILLIGGAIWFALRWFRQQKAGASMPAGPGMYSARESMAEPSFGQTAFNTAPATTLATVDDELAQGMANITSMDPTFDEARFLEGAKMAFQHIQGAWADWSVERLRPLLTERMWTLIQAQAAERRAAGKRDVIEKIRFNEVSISEAWQEAGEDWITVHLLVDMVDYTTDVQGTVLEGDPKVSSLVEEYWTFNRPVGSRDPNWYLSAIQQPGEVAKSVL